MQTTFLLILKCKVMKSYLIFIGVDISKNSLDICSLNADKPKEMKHTSIANEPKAIAKFLKSLNKMEAIFCMEDTGVYGLHLYKTLTESSFDYAVVPAIQIKRSKGLSRGKSDKADAKDIALYALTHQHDLPLYHLPEPDLQELKLLLAERDKLIKALKLFESTNEATCYTDRSACSSLKKNNGKTINYLQKQLKEMDELIQNILKNNETMKEQMELLQSIPGIGQQTAIQLIVFTKCFTAFKEWRQLACYAGVAPFEFSSGSSVRGRTKVNHLADKKMKSLLNSRSL